MSVVNEFLLARIAEKEAYAWWVLGHDEAGPHYDPSRELAECAAQRHIVEREVDDQILRDLAAVYADHPDFREVES